MIGILKKLKHILNRINKHINFNFNLIINKIYYILIKNRRLYDLYL